MRSLGLRGLRVPVEEFGDRACSDSSGPHNEAVLCMMTKKTVTITLAMPATMRKLTG